MLQTSNVEPRRAWERRHKHTGLWTEDDLTSDGETCTTCGSDEGVTYSRGVAFCSECLEWSRQKNLNEYYDDLGMPG